MQNGTRPTRLAPQNGASAMDGLLLGSPALAEDGTIFVANGRNISAVSPNGKILSQVIIGTGAQASLTLVL
jgi:hypothetical protein